MKKSAIKILISVRNLDYGNALSRAVKSLINKQVELKSCRGIKDYEFNSFKYDFILLDLSQLIDDPFVGIQSICERFPTSKIIILTLWDQPKLIEKILQSGAFGTYLIGSDVEPLISTLETA